jgi:hypothetical protein
MKEGTPTIHTPEEAALLALGEVRRNPDATAEDIKEAEEKY